MLAIDVLLFGPIGITVWAVQMIWIPVTAAGIINGAGHYWGYRNFQPADASTNIVPWGILIGGEELHNNHHAHIGSAQAIQQMVRIRHRLAVYPQPGGAGAGKDQKRIAPKVRINTAKTVCDIDTLHAVMAHRYEVMAKYAKFLKKTYREEIAQLKMRMPGLGKVDLKRVKHWLHADVTVLSEQEKLKLGLVMRTSRKLEYRLLVAPGTDLDLAAFHGDQGTDGKGLGGMVSPRRNQRYRSLATIFQTPALLRLSREEAGNRRSPPVRLITLYCDALNIAEKPAL